MSEKLSLSFSTFSCSISIDESTEWFDAASDIASRLSLALPRKWTQVRLSMNQLETHLIENRRFATLPITDELEPQFWQFLGSLVRCVLTLWSPCHLWSWESKSSLTELFQITGLWAQLIPKPDICKLNADLPPYFELSAQLMNSIRP